MTNPYNIQSRFRHAGTRFKQMTNGDGEGLVTLSRTGEPNTPDVSAHPILVDAEEHIPGVSITRVEFQDWGIDSEDYTFDGNVLPPQPGDFITRPNGSVFRVVPYGTDEPCFQFVDSDRTRMIVHTERIGEPT